LEKQNFIREYLEKLNTVEGFFRNKLNELFQDFDKLRKKMSNKKQSVLINIKA
jgi:hypothetical protein